MSKKRQDRRNELTSVALVGVVPISKQIKLKTFYGVGAESCSEKATALALAHTLPINEKMATSVTLIRTLQLLCRRSPSNMNRMYALR